jgi:RNA polymerase sigma-70 factor, ECF subfamily
METRTEYIIMEQVRDGDTAGFEKIVAAYAPRIIRLAQRLVGNREEAEDIAQEAFLRLYRGLADFRGESSLGTWLYRTVSRLAIDFLRRENLRRRIFFFRPDNNDCDLLEGVADPALSPNERLLLGEKLRRLQKALDRLSPRQRAVFVLRHKEGLPIREIAALLGLGEGTVKVHLHRAVGLLRQELADLV